MTKKVRTLDEEIALYKKLNQTIYMIVSINRAQERGDSITVELMNKQVLANLEELSAVPYHSSIKKILDYKKRFKDYLLEKCEDHEKRSEIIYADNLEHLINQTEIEEEKFNLLTMYGSDIYSWWQKLLSSNFSLDRRSIMYIDILMMTSNPEMFIRCTESIEKQINDEIFGYINKTGNLKNKIFEILAMHRPSLIELLQEKKLVNFGNIGMYYLSLILKKGMTFYDIFKTLYNGLSQEEKQTYIPSIILCSKNDPSMLLDMLDLDFNPTPDFIQALGHQTRINIEKIDEDYGINEYRNMIAEKILRKSSNKDEYKKNKAYVKKYIDETDYQKHLEKKREELSTLLYNLNEKLQEEVPGKTKIKNINFKK